MKTQHIILALLTISGLISCGGQAGSAQKGVIDSYSGSVFIDGKPAVTGIEVAAGMEIVTSEGGWCDILFPGKNIVRIYDNSQVVFTLSPDKELILKAGNIGNILSDLKEWEKGFIIETETSVVIVRGTVFFVAAESPTNVYVCCCNGSVDVKEKSSGKINALSAAHHQGLSVSLNASLPAGMLYHGDEDMDILAAELKKKIDWKKIGGLTDE